MQTNEVLFSMRKQCVRYTSHAITFLPNATKIVDANMLMIFLSTPKNHLGELHLKDFELIGF